MSNFRSKAPVMSTAGAISVRTEKGEMYMEKVHVQRYVAGKRPDFAGKDDSDYEEEEKKDPFVRPKKTLGARLPKADKQVDPTELTKLDPSDRRLRRLMAATRKESSEEESDEDRVERHRRHRGSDFFEPAVEAEEEEDVDEDELERRRNFLRMRARQREVEDELMARQDSEEEQDESEEDELTEEEYTSEEDETQPRLKPVFVRKKDRITLTKDPEIVALETEKEAKRLEEQKRRATLQLLQQESRKEIEDAQSRQNALDSIISDDEDQDEAYEAWKLRELKRIKRDREEREAKIREKEELERIRNMPEEQRLLEFKKRPKIVTNKAAKGKYRYLQKYYHRGVFYMDEEEDLLKRDFAQPTLEDRFDKTVLPKVMQVKNFGRAGRTKYTHLVDQDTTDFESPWVSDATQNLKFHNQKGGGMKTGFNPSSSTSENNKSYKDS